MVLARLALLLSAALAHTCPEYEAISTPEAQRLDPDKYVKGFWYETNSANVFLTKGCQCTRYNMTRTSPTTFDDVFTCHKNAPNGAVTTLPNKGSFDADVPGKMVESLGPVSPPYWVLKVYPELPDPDGADYAASLVYACVGALGFSSEYVYLFSRTPTLPAGVEADMRSHLALHNISQDAILKVPMANCTWA